MKNTQTRTKVIFRKYRKGGDIIALFPAMAHDVNGRYCVSYQHIGQHGGACYSGTIRDTVPALPAEYEALRKELESIGYVLEIAKRETQADRQHRTLTLA